MDVRDISNPLRRCLDDPSRRGPATPSRGHRGAGFGGLEAAHRLKGAPVSITLLDRRNHHLFQPLLYQVATASLATSEIRLADPLFVARSSRITTCVATVTASMLWKSACCSRWRALPYDVLVLATGARHAYLPMTNGSRSRRPEDAGRRHHAAAAHSGGLRTCERETDPQRRAALLTFVIVGAGPTGVELAGTTAELAKDTLRPDFRNIDTDRRASC